MSHAERCPICYGEGEVTKPIHSSVDHETKKCHGCNGCGWVTVRG